MIITCPCGEKKFEVAENLIPEKGRLLKCGSCDETWFFNKNDEVTKKIQKPTPKKDKLLSKPQKTLPNKEKKSIIYSNNNKGSEIVKYQPKSTFTFSNFLSYILVGIISIIGFVIILDTFKSSLYVFFPNLEFLLFSFYETLKDVELFVKDLI